MKHNTYLKNCEAICALNRGDLHTAQLLLRQNVKYERCLTTINNLGVFYSENNMLDANLRERDGRKMALHYLMQVVEDDFSGVTSFAMASTFFKLEMYNKAIQCFDKSFNLKKQFASKYNAGLCYFKERKYEQAYIAFRSAASLAECDERIDAILSIAFSEAYFHKSVAPEISLQVFRHNDILDYDKFVLAYLLSDEKMIDKYVIPTIKGFSLGKISRVMAIDALLFLKRKKEADEFYKLSIEWLEEEDCNNSKEISQLKRIMEDGDYRKMLICEYLPPLEFQKKYCYLL